MAGVFFNLECKRTESSREPNWKSVLTTSLDQSLQALSEGVKEQRPKYLAALTRLEDLRAQISLHWGKSSTAIENIDKFLTEVLRPYLQLVADTRRYFTLPSDELPETAKAEIAKPGPLKYLHFSWKCLFDSNNVAILSGNVNVEIVCLMFNWAVLLFNQATNTMFTGADAESCKNGYRQYSNAAGMFDQARQIAEKEIPSSQLSFDITPTSFEILRDLALGLAHRCAYMKATQETATKDNAALLSKLAMTGAKHLREKVIDRLAVLAEGRSVNNTFKELQSNTSDNAAYLEAESYLCSLRIDFKENKCGITIAKARIAMAILNERITQKNHPNSSNRDWLNAKSAEIRAVHDEANGFNSTVYFQNVPTGIEPLPTLASVLAKPLPQFNHEDFSNVDEHSGQPFKGLVGPEIIPLLQKFREAVTAEYGRLSKTVNAKRNDASEAISKLELDALLCQSEEGERPHLPTALREKVKKLQKQAKEYLHDQQQHSNNNNNNSSSTGNKTAATTTTTTPAQMLQMMLRHVANICAAVEPVLNEAEQTLNKDIERDEQYLQSYGEKLWRSRVRPSNELPDFPAFRKRIAEIRNVVNKEAKEVLQQIVKTLNDNAQALLRVGQPVESLDDLIPASASPTKEQRVAISIRTRLRELRANLESVNDTEMSLLRMIPPMISSPDIAAAVGSCKKENREDVLAAKQVEVIDQFAGVNALSEQRQQILDQMEKLVLELATVQSDDPMLKEKATVIKSIERGIQVVEGGVMRISDLSMQVSNMIDFADTLKQNCLSLVAARDIEAKNIASQLDVQLNQSLRKLKQQQELAALEQFYAASQKNPEQQSQQQQTQQQQKQQQIQQAPLSLNMTNQQRTDSWNSDNGSSGSPTAQSASANNNSNPMFQLPNSNGSPPNNNNNNNLQQQNINNNFPRQNSNDIVVPPPPPPPPPLSSNQQQQQQQQHPQQRQLTDEMFGIRNNNNNNNNYQHNMNNMNNNNNNGYQQHQNNNSINNSYAPPDFTDPFSAASGQSRLAPPPPPPPPPSHYQQQQQQQQPNNNNSSWPF